MSGERCLDCVHWGATGCAHQEGCELFERVSRRGSKSQENRNVWDEALAVKRKLEAAEDEQYIW